MKLCYLPQAGLNAVEKATGVQASGSDIRKTMVLAKELGKALKHAVPLHTACRLPVSGTLS